MEASFLSKVRHICYDRILEQGGTNSHITFGNAVSSVSVESIALILDENAFYQYDTNSCPSNGVDQYQHTYDGDYGRRESSKTWDAGMAPSKLDVYFGVKDVSHSWRHNGNRKMFL